MAAVNIHVSYAHKNVADYGFGDLVITDVLRRITSPADVVLLTDRIKTETGKEVIVIIAWQYLE